jgi:hypothetical protein
MSDEDELQEILGTGEMTWRISNQRKYKDHVGHVASLLGSEEGDTLIYCDCSWAMRFAKKATLKDVEREFVGHVQPGREHIE